MLFTLILYILLLIVFLIVTALIIRYTLKFSYLSPNFKYAVGIYTIIAALLIIFSIYLLIQADPSSSNFNVNSLNDGELNF